MFEPENGDSDPQVSPQRIVLIYNIAVQDKTRRRMREIAVRSIAQKIEGSKVNGSNHSDQDRDMCETCLR